MGNKLSHTPSSEWCDLNVLLAFGIFVVLFVTVLGIWAALS